MKIKLGPYIDSGFTVKWYNTYMFDKHGWDYEDNTNIFEKVLEKSQDFTNYLLDKTINKLHTRKRVEYIHIDDYDIWDMDGTLASIIHPMLLLLKAKKHGAPTVSDEDVPMRLRNDHIEHTSDEWYALCCKKWEYVLDLMIWSFSDEGMNDPPRLHHHTDQIYYQEIHPVHQARATHGRMMFAKYYLCLWD
jgi:hypothetical protein